MLLLLLLFACTPISENSRITRAVPDTVNLDKSAMDRSVAILGDIYVPGGFDVDNQEAGLNVTIRGAPAESFRVFRYNENVPEGLLPGRMITYIAAVVSGTAETGVHDVVVHVSGTPVVLEDGVTCERAEPEPEPEPEPGKEVTVSIDPTSSSLYVGDELELTASVTGTDNTAVTWTVDPAVLLTVTGGSATFEAPEQLGEYVITATSDADPNRSAMATVQVLRYPLLLDPIGVILNVGETARLRVWIDEVPATDDEVSWSAEHGTLTGGGHEVTWKAPSTPGMYEVTVTSTDDPDIRRTSTMEVLAN